MTRLEEIEERYNDAMDVLMPPIAKDTRLLKLAKEDVPFLLTEIVDLTTANAKQAEEIERLTAFWESSPLTERVRFTLAYNALKGEKEDKDERI